MPMSSAAPATRRLSNSTLAHLLLLVVVAIWGATFVLVKDALQDASPLLFNLIRMVLAFLAMVVLNYRHLRNLSRRAVVSGLVVGIFLSAGYQFQTAGLARTTPAKSAFITGLIVVFVPCFTIFRALRPAGTHAPRWNAILGTLFAFSGLMLLTTPSGTRLAEVFTTIGLGDLLTLACAIAFAAHLIALAHFAPNLPAAQIATLQIGFAALCMAVTLPFGGALRLTFTPRLFIALIVTSLLATAAAFTIQSWAQQYIPPTHTAVLLTLEPVFAYLTSLLFLHERLGPRSLTGGSLILVGIAIIEFLSPTPIPPA